MVLSEGKEAKSSDAERLSEPRNQVLGLVFLRDLFKWVASKNEGRIFQKGFFGTDLLADLF